MNTTTGPVVGHAETGVAAFRGIPYAAPPTRNHARRPRGCRKSSAADRNSEP
ncbi:carboxylesterase family protein [Corynebacterium kroppenstedtii]|nr:carboxylesterase family protein [Corynebacterium pseudokroppenstedtii]QRP15631.1 carboxylesterase family protein [Corynebacterium kroppenstedtii]